LETRGVEVLQIPRWRKHPRRGLDLKFLMKKLAKRGVTSILIEGGGKVNASALEMGLVDKVLFFIAPKIGRICLEDSGKAHPSVIAKDEVLKQSRYYR